MNISGSILANYWRKQSFKEEEAVIVTPQPEANLSTSPKIV
jgi:hypothetical protein